MDISNLYLVCLVEQGNVNHKGWISSIHAEEIHVNSPDPFTLQSRVQISVPQLGVKFPVNNLECHQELAWFNHRMEILRLDPGVDQAVEILTRFLEKHF
ncbi:MAG: hypothetical protein OEW12_08790 [Deltaproteobacteria bacterium]|nr:hypothetical protein [Deltaproteobacteria bacterium]